MEKVAVLASGGLDSSVLLTDVATSALAYPVYVRAGLAWEEEELSALEQFVEAIGMPNIQPVTVLSLPMEQIYGDHWSVTGIGVPAAAAPDAEVFLPGRNILLIGLAATWCSTRGVSQIVLGTLGGNPFPDATREFFEALATVLSQGLGHRINVSAPYRRLPKKELIGRNSHLPLHLTLTCMAPEGDVHCGRCNKCHERQRAFSLSGVADRTPYATAVWEG